MRKVGVALEFANGKKNWSTKEKEILKEVSFQKNKEKSLVEKEILLPN